MTQLTAGQDDELASVFPAIKKRKEDFYADKPYRILRAYTDTQMETLVSEEMSRGWHPIGPPTLNFFRRSTGTIQLIYLQSLVRTNMVIPVISGGKKSTEAA